MNNTLGVSVDSYFYLNLDRRPDRLSNINGQIKKSLILTNNIKRFPAIDGRNIDPRWLPRKIIHNTACDQILSTKPFVWGVTMTAGGLGCYFTHCKMFEHALQKNKVTLVLEDDAIIADNFDIKLQDTLNNLPEDFDFCYLGFHDTSFKKLYFTSSVYKPEGQITGLFSYIVSPTGAKKILSKIFPIKMQLDSYMHSLQGEDINFFTVNEAIVTSPSVTSSGDIQGAEGCIKNYTGSNKVYSIVQ